jgi:hypothetical protein
MADLNHLTLETLEDGTGSSIQPVEQAKQNESSNKFADALQGLPLNGIEDAEPIEALFKLRKSEQHDDEEEAFMPKGKVSLIAGYGGTGKSLLALELALLVANRNGRYSRAKGTKGQHLVANSKTHKVVIFFGEEDDASCKWRLKQAFTSLDAINNYRELKDNLLVIPLGGAPFNTAFINKEDITEADKWFQELKKRLALFGGKDGLDLIVIDPLSHFGGGEFEQDNGQAVQLMRKLNELTQFKGSPTVLGIHHSPKGSSSKRLDEMLRGSSALKDNSRWVGVMSRLGEDMQGRDCFKWVDGGGVECEIIQLEVVKSNYTRRGMPIRFAIGADGLKEITNRAYLEARSDVLNPNSTCKEDKYYTLNEHADDLMSQPAKASNPYGHHGGRPVRPRKN